MNTFLTKQNPGVESGNIKIDEWLKSQCNRHVNGRCDTAACLQRGGCDISKPCDHDLATCEAHETLTAIIKLREAVRELLDMATDNRAHGPEIDRACDALKASEV